VTPVEPLREIAARLEAAGIRDARVVPGRVSTEPWPSIGREVEVTSGSALRPAAPIVVFFDPLGQLIGWRDRGRQGAGAKPAADPDGIREAVVRELGLGPATRLGGVRAVLLPPLGWTLEVGLFPAPLPQPARAIRVWLDPASRRVIQCLFEAEEER